MAAAAAVVAVAASFSSSSSSAFAAAGVWCQCDKGQGTRDKGGPRGGLKSKIIRRRRGKGQYEQYYADALNPTVSRARTDCD